MNDELLREMQLTHAVVHDLKNPLSGIMMLAQLLLRETPDVATQHEFGAKILAASATIHRMLNNLLDLHRHEKNELSCAWTKVDLNDIVANAAQHMASCAQDREQTLNLRLSPHKNFVRIDCELVRRLCENLIENACRYAPTGGVIEVVTEMNGSGERVELRICDQGPSVALASRLRMFERDAVLDPDASVLLRLGRSLSLPFCKMVANLMHGEIESKAGSPSGHVFALYLPPST